MVLDRLKNILPQKRWYDVCAKNDNQNGWGKESTHILNVAKKYNIRVGSFQAQGDRFIGVYCRGDELQQLMDVLGKEEYTISESTDADLLGKNIVKEVVVS